MSDILNQSMLSSFKKKIGSSAFHTIETMIQEELQNSKINIVYNAEYLLYLFEIAILKNCEIEGKAIPKIIASMGNPYTPAIDFQQLQSIHQNSIQLMISYFNNHS